MGLAARLGEVGDLAPVADHALRDVLQRVEGRDHLHLPVGRGGAGAAVVAEGGAAAQGQGAGQQAGGEGEPGRSGRAGRSGEVHENDSH
nr:hypothetical protein [Nocardioides scoriae]